MERELSTYRQVTEASLALQSCRDVETAGEVIAESLMRGFGFDTVVIALVEGPIRLLRGLTAAPADEIDLNAIDFPPLSAEHAWAEITSVGAAEHADAAEADDPRLAPLNLTGRSWRPAWLPLVAKGEPMGLIIALCRSERPPTDEGERRGLALFANHAALTLAGLGAKGDAEDDAVRDALTGLYNRRHFDRALRQEIRRFRRYGNPPALLMIDLNEFKSYNDTHGHAMGDRILAAAAQLIEDNVRETDLVARYGGDEFVVLMPDADEEQARTATRRIQAAVDVHNRRHHDQPTKLFTLTVGHHVATSETAERVLESADRMMYDRKDDGSRRRLLDQLVSSSTAPIGQHARLIFGLMKTLAMKDPTHLPHSRRVMGYCMLMCERLGLSPIRCEQIAMAAILHDIGKVVINAEILRRPGPLTPSELMLVKSHPVVAADMLAEIPFLEHPLRLIRHHHERWDGRTDGESPGYPSGLMGETIPLGSRLIGIADLFDGLTTPRPWRETLSIPEAIRAMRAESGRSLDPNLLARCLPILEELEAPIDPETVKCPLTA